MLLLYYFYFLFIRFDVGIIGVEFWLNKAKLNSRITHSTWGRDPRDALCGMKKTSQAVCGAWSVSLTSARAALLGGCFQIGSVGASKLLVRIWFVIQTFNNKNIDTNMYFIWNVSGLDKMLLVTCKFFLFLFVKKKKFNVVPHLLFMSDFWIWIL